MTERDRVRGYVKEMGFWTDTASYCFPFDSWKVVCPSSDSLCLYIRAISRTECMINTYPEQTGSTEHVLYLLQCRGEGEGMKGALTPHGSREHYLKKDFTETFVETERWVGFESLFSLSSSSFPLNF